MLFDHPDNNPVLVLSPDESWELLKRAGYGRLILHVAERIDIFPVNFALDDHTLVFRTAPGTKLAELSVNEEVVFEVDEILQAEGWSVVVRGTAERLEASGDVERAQKLNLKPWLPTHKDHYVRITPTEVSGRHFHFGEHPERELGEGSEQGL